MGSGGNGSPAHVIGEYFKMMTGVNLVHVPYRGGAPALTDLIGGQIQGAFIDMAASVGYNRAGQPRALGVATPTRPEAAPGIPTPRGVGAGFRGESVGWPQRAEEHAVRDRRETQYGDQCRPRRA